MLAIFGSDDDKTLWFLIVETAALARLYNTSHWNTMACLERSVSFVHNSHTVATGQYLHFCLTPLPTSLYFCLGLSAGLPVSRITEVVSCRGDLGTYYIEEFFTDF